jgi:hypothetical protein
MKMAVVRISAAKAPNEVPSKRLHGSKKRREMKVLPLSFMFLREKTDVQAGGGKTKTISSLILLLQPRSRGIFLFM